MEANRVLYKIIVDRHSCILRKSTKSVYELVPSYFVIYFGFLFAERSGKTVYGKSVESISFFMAYICLHNQHFPLDYNSNQSVKMLQRLPYNLTVARLLHKYDYSLVKYSQKIA